MMLPSGWALVNGISALLIKYRATPGAKMIYVKSVLAGIAGAMAAVVIWFVAELLFPLLLVSLLSRVTGSGGIGAVSAGTGSALAAGFIGFVAGFGWQFRRSSRAASTLREP